MATETDEKSSGDERDEGNEQEQHGSKVDEAESGGSDSGGSDSGGSDSGGSDSGGSESGGSESGGSDAGEDASQEELAERYEQEKREQAEQSRRRVPMFQIAAVAAVVAVGLVLFELGSTVQGNHPLATEGLLLLGLVNLGAGLALFVRKNWSRTLVLVTMVFDIIGVLLAFTLVGPGKFVAFVLCLVVLFLMFRQPVLDEYDAPKE